MTPVDLGWSPRTALVANVVVWFVWSLMVGYLGHRWPRQAFERDYWWSRLRRFEWETRFYATHLRVGAWKDLLPELGGLFPDGFAKRRVARSDPAHLQRFLIETRRAEAVHWVVFWLWPVFGIWNPPWAVAVMAVYAATVNLPCVLVQRYNRRRLFAVLGRHERRRVPRARRHLIPDLRPVATSTTTTTLVESILQHRTHRGE